MDEEVQFMCSGMDSEPYRPQPSPPMWTPPPVLGQAIFTAILYGLAVWIGAKLNIYYAPEARIPWDIFYYVAYASWVWGYACNEGSTDGQTISAD